MGVQPRCHDGSLFWGKLVKQSRYSLLGYPFSSAEVPSAQSINAIISTLLLKIIIFERYCRSKIKTIQTFSFACCWELCWIININLDRNDCSTVLNVKVRTMEIILKKGGVAIKLSKQLASSLNLIWKSVVALAFLLRLVDMKTFPVILLFWNI